MQNLPFCLLALHPMLPRAQTLNPSTLSEPLTTLDPHPFDQRLALQISSLVPSFQTGFISFAWLIQAQSVLLSSLDDLEKIVDGQELPFSRKEEKLIDDFLEECIKGLDVCNGIKQGIAEARKRHMQLKLVVEVLDVGKERYSEARLRRARKLLWEYREGNRKGDNKEEPECLPKANNSDGVDYVRENQVMKTASVARRHLRVITGKLLGEDRTLLRSLRRLGSGELSTDSKYGIAIYAVRQVTAFLLSTILASVTSKRGLLSSSQEVGRRYHWSSVLESLQGDVMEEMQKRAKRGGNGYLIWELDQLCVCVKHIYDLVDCLVMLKKFPLLELQEEEIRKAVVQLKRQQEPIQIGLETMNRKICEVYRHLISTRTKIDNFHRSPEDRSMRSRT